MAGRKMQPLSVIEGKGRSNHITKAEAERRKAHEEKMRGFTDDVKPPSYLTASQKNEFEKIANELMRLEIFSNLDVDALARYIDSKTEYIKVTKELRKIKKPSDDIKLYTDLRINRNTFYNECRSAASDLGLTITSRLKLVLPKTKEEKPMSEAERRFGGRL
jgi:P27 family predicted phage terminase small subunit